MKYFYVVMMIFFIISCKSVEKNTQTSSNINFNDGWINEDKFVTTSIGYPNGFTANKEDAKESAFNAALALSKVKIENAFVKELPNKNNNVNDLKDVVEKYIKIEYSNFIDDRYYQIKTTVEYDNLLSLLREGNIKKILN
ncbi:hypothetical protein R4K55_10310 [Brachyspira alvinipulli]|uniref:hypothetical protein n=1 Tax=Brachyspira alvinipulli TaxID=84379 RepID=UPI00262D3C95|nr:hypothetical protein [uncultured Brachyspira sp.]